jgi:predicted metal-binding membrane protein
VTLFQVLTRQRPDANRLAALLIAGYLGVWTLFGLLVYLGDWVIHQAVERSAWLEANAWALGAATLALAGLYQFTPLKYHCLDKCRSPLSFVVEHWRGRRERLQAWWLGVHHGLFCVGCCWSLMLLMFTVGVGSLGWMLVVGAVMAAEKNLPWGRRLSAPLGGALLAWAVALVLLTLATPGVVHHEPH